MPVARARGYGGTALVARGNGGDDNGGDDWTDDEDRGDRGDDMHTGSCEAHDANLRYIVRALKSGNINQGYAQCYVDELRRAVEEGKCSPERIQCRQYATLRATPVVAGAVVTWTIRPVGKAFARELIDASFPVVAAAPNIDVIFTGMDGAGRTGIVGVVAQTTGPGGNVATGASARALAAARQNYVVPSGVIFDAANNLTINGTNLAGADDATIEAMLTYDSVRYG